MAQSLSKPPSASNRLLGLVGILGGLILVAAFVPAIPWTADAFNLRLILFNVGAIAIVIAVRRRQALVAPALALLAALPALFANAWYLTMIVLATARPGPFPGELGLIFFWAGAAMWLADAWFGLITLRLGIVSRWGGLALAAGSALALTGMDRLDLVTGPFAQFFQPVALAGIALNGIGWILLGIEVATRQVVARSDASPATT